MTFPFVRSFVICGSLIAAAAFGASPDLRLIEAVKAQDETSPRALLKQRIDLNAQQGDGSTALHFAAYFDNLPVADLLIRAGAHVDTANDLGSTPMHLACNNGNAAMVERLLA